MDYCNDVTSWLTTGGDLSLAADLTGNNPEVTIAELIGRGVTHVLDVRSEWTDADLWGQVAPGVRYCHAPIIDDHSHFCGESWYKAVEGFVSDFLANAKPGDRLYSHCHMGVNRGTSAAMLALLVENPDLDPYVAFRIVREARPVAGLVYAEQVGMRHLKNRGRPVVEFKKAMRDYWTADRRTSVNRGIAYYRTQEGGTLKVGGEPVLTCPVLVSVPGTLNPHRIKWNSGTPVCMDCGSLAVSV